MGCHQHRNRPVVRRRVGPEVHQGAAFWEIGTNSFDRSGVFTLTSQGYVSPSHEDLAFPDIAAPDHGPAALFFTLTGNGGPTGADNGGFFPSTAFGRLSAGAGDLQGSKVNVVDLGQSPEDGFGEYLGFPGRIGPRWGDYSAGVYDPLQQQDLLLHQLHPVPELRAPAVHPDAGHLRRYQGRLRQLGHFG